MRLSLAAISSWLESWKAKRDFEIFFNLLEPRDDDVILDIGAGYGWIANKAAQACKELIALEPDRKRALHMRRSYPGVSAVSASGEALPFQDSCFEKIYLKKSFHHLGDQGNALKELDRVLKPAGSLVIHELDPKREGKFVKFLESRIRRSHVDFLTPSELENRLEQGGFLVRSVRTARTGYFAVAAKKQT